MKLKTTTLCLSLALGLAMLTACNQHDNAAIDGQAAAADTVSDDAMPSDAMASDVMDDAAGAPTTGPNFASMDKNQDGGVSIVELAPCRMVVEHFSVADADGDGSLSEAEFDAHLVDMQSAGDPTAEMGFVDMDWNQDGSLEVSELALCDTLYGEFAAVDADGNDSLSDAEITAFRAGNTAAPAP